MISEENKRQLFVPRGLAHGYLVISEKARVFYKVDNLYNKESERGLSYNDPELNIDWGKYLDSPPVLSDKDTLWPKLRELV